MSSLLVDLLRQSGGTAVIDGGLATELERHGADLNDPLWSAKCLFSSPHLIRQVHLDYLENGADIIITASYQATIQGFKDKGYTDEESEAMLRRSVEIAREARELYYKGCSECCSGDGAEGKILKQRPILIAASVGSYGAYLADGSEYRFVNILESGDYGDAITKTNLKDFHRRRVQILADSGADLLAFETVPNKLEAEFELQSEDIHGLSKYICGFSKEQKAVLVKIAYAELLEEEDIKIPAWFAFNSKDGVNVVSGDSLLECGSIAESCNKVVAVGINCTPPRFIHDLIVLLKKVFNRTGIAVTTKPIVIYPNSGETYDAELKQWVQNTGVTDEHFISYVTKWRELGASLVGGCCRTTPATIRKIYNVLSSSESAIVGKE
ncbi:Selenocysteine methyltransferase [Vigna angularis]|uniref:Selenocysteine methyltransferase n=1 Tax=Phaseolus angularis TaxID=3914 RepID=A0A8T0KZK7_PHAAN|nr:Selenocysteine methyltransferase [Vigna angularis]